MPRILPVGGRGPYAVGIATEHIRTPVATVGEGAKATPSEEELWHLEVMAQVSTCTFFCFEGFICFSTRRLFAVSSGARFSLHLLLRSGAVAAGVS